MAISIVDSTILYRILCAYCDTQDEQRFIVRHGAVLPEPTLPVGWHQFPSYGVVCAVHTIRYEIDGVMLDEIDGV